MTSASCYITSASRYHPRYQRRFSMYIRGLILRNWLRQFRLEGKLLCQTMCYNIAKIVQKIHIHKTNSKFLWRVFRGNNIRHNMDVANT